MVVCVSSFLLGDFMIQGVLRKVNGAAASFTICLQADEFRPFFVHNPFKNIIKVHIDKKGVPC